MNCKEKAHDLKKGLTDGTISGAFLIQNASSRDWYGGMVILSEMLRDPTELQFVIGRLIEAKKLKRKAAEKEKTIIIGIGAGALNILNLLKYCPIPENDILFLDSDPWILGKCFHPKLQLPWANMLFMTPRKDGKFIPLSWGGVHHGGAELGRLMAVGFAEEIAKTVIDVDTAAMVTCLGGATGSGASPAVAAILKEMGVKIFAIIQTPFPFEYRKRSEAACESLGIIQQLADKTVVIEGKEFLKRLHRKTTLLGAFKALDIEMTNCVKDTYNNAKE